MWVKHLSYILEEARGRYVFLQQSNAKNEDLIASAYKSWKNIINIYRRGFSLFSEYLFLDFILDLLLGLSHLC